MFNCTEVKWARNWRMLSGNDQLCGVDVIIARLRIIVENCAMNSANFSSMLYQLKLSILAIKAKFLKYLAQE